MTYNERVADGDGNANGDDRGCSEKKVGQLLRGYPRKRNSREVIFVELEPFSESSAGDHDTFGMVSFPTARVSRCHVGSDTFDPIESPIKTPQRDADDSTKKMWLAGLLYAPKGTQLHAFANLFSRIEHLSHVLCWSEMAPTVDAANGSIRTFNVIELPRLGLNFEARKVQTESGDSELRLYSVDHGHLFINVDRSLAGHPLFERISHSIVLTTESEEEHVLVPNIKMERPVVKHQPFSTNVVLDYNNKKWRENSKNLFYLFKIHVSNGFAFASSFEAELYLLANLVLARDFARAFEVASRVFTDIGLTNEGQQNLDLALKYTNKNLHPDALAVQARLYLQLSDAPVVLEINIAKVMSEHINRHNHVSAQCRLTPAEELDLLLACDDFQSAVAVIATLVEQYPGHPGGVEDVRLLIKALEGEKLYEAKKKKAAEFMKKLSVAIQDQDGVTLRPERIKSIVKLIIHKEKKHKTTEIAKWVLQNRRIFIENTAIGIPKPTCLEPVVPVMTPNRKEVKEWWGVPIEPLQADQNISGETLYADQGKVFNHGVGDVTQAVKYLCGAPKASLNGKKCIPGFLFLYQCFVPHKTTISFKFPTLANCSRKENKDFRQRANHTLATLMYLQLQNANTRTVLDSILACLVQNPELCTSNLPKFVDKNQNKRKTYKDIGTDYTRTPPAIAFLEVGVIIQMRWTRS